VNERERERIVARCERFVTSWTAPHDPAETFRALAERAGPRMDVYGGGKSVKRLESRVARLLGKEAAVLFPSGTMAQPIALRIWCDRSRCSTVGFHPQCHLDVHEERGYEHLHGLHARPIGERDRLVTRAALDDVNEPLGALLLELPQRDLGGQLPTWRELRAQTTWARRRGVALHLDGARLWQCGPFYRRPLSEIAALFDTVYVSLYKDLGGLGGCVLAGPKNVIAEARVWRIRHGGRLSTYEPMALSAERGLDELLPRMPAFVRKAREIGAALARVDGIDVLPDPPQVAMLHVHVRGDHERMEEARVEIAKERRTLIAGYFAPTAVTGVQRTELAIGPSSLDVPTAEIAELYAELVTRAAKSRRAAPSRRGARATGSGRSRGSARPARPK
jgi:threonine aldolase